MKLNRPRLRTILLIVNLLVLVMPIAAIGVLRIYETELLRRTEAELISQVALIEAHYREDLRRELEGATLTASLSHYGRPTQAPWALDAHRMFRPIGIDLDLSRAEILPPEGPPEPPRGAVDPVARRIGARHQVALEQAQRTTLSGMRIVDVEGNVVASTSTSEQGMSVHHHQEIQAALGGEVVKSLRERGNMPAHTTLKGLARQTRMRIYIAKPVLLEGRVVGAVAAWRTPLNLAKGLYENRYLFGGLLAIIFVGGLTITGLTAFYIGWPIRRLIGQTEHIAEGAPNGRQPIAKPGTYEIQALSRAMAEMAQSLEERSHYIKTFARNVSHEFKTPLTSIRGTVELLQDHLEEMTSPQREAFLAIVDADAHRLERLVSRLLELARADVLQPTTQPLAIEPILEQIAQSLSDADFEVTVYLCAEAVDVAMEAEVFESIISNLIVNARQQGASKLDLRVEVDEEERLVALTLRDDGPGISAANADKIFDEFFTTGRDHGGTGLGLAIVRTLLTTHGGSIALVSGDRGATFKVLIPLV